MHFASSPSMCPILLNQLTTIFLSIHPKELKWNTQCDQYYLFIFYLLNVSHLETAHFSHRHTREA